MRDFTPEQRALLRSSYLKVNLLVTMWLDEGVQRYCDDVQDLVIDGVTYTGANALIDASDISASAPLAAEGVVIRVDGNRLYQSGVPDPAFVLNALFTTNYHQRRVDLDYSFSDDTGVAKLVLPGYAGKINSAKLLEPAGALKEPGADFPILEITLDALAARYGRRTYRTRSHDDHMQLTGGTDMFFSFVAGAQTIEETLYWGKSTPGDAQRPQGHYAGLMYDKLWQQNNWGTRGQN